MAVFVLAALASGCARRVSVADLEGGGAEVGAVVTLTSGETVRCRLLSLSGEEMLVEVYYPLRGNVELRGSGPYRTVAMDGEPVRGELTTVERDGTQRTARVRRTILLNEIANATFHRSGSEASLGPILSAVTGPVLGALLALAM